MRGYFAGSILATAVAVAVLALTVMPGAAQQQKKGTADKGADKGPVIVLPKAGSPPAPRLPDGHIDLGNGKGSWNAYTIKDFSGHGFGDQPVQNAGKRGPQLVEHVVDVQMLPWAQKFYDNVDATLSKDDPEALCIPPGLPREEATPFPFQIYQLPDRLVFVYEGGAHMWRIVYTDGRKHSTDATDYPSFLGESIGHWEGDTMVVDSIGFKNGTWLDAAGHPHTEKLHVVMRYDRTSLDNLHIAATIEDPETYVKPWTTSWNIHWMAGITPLEYICQEENLDVKHLVGK